MNCLKCRSKTKLKVRADGVFFCAECGQKMQENIQSIGAARDSKNIGVPSDVLNFSSVSETIMNKMLNAPTTPTNSQRMFKKFPIPERKTHTQYSNDMTNSALLQECDPEELRKKLRSEYLNIASSPPPAPPPLPTVGQSEHTVKTSEQLIKEQLLSQVMSNFKCPGDHSFLSANVDQIPANVPVVVNAVQQNRSKFISNYDTRHSKPPHTKHAGLLSKSLPPPMQARPHLIKTQSTANHRPQSSVRQSIELSAEKHNDHKTGQESDKSDKPAQVQDVDALSFVDFIKQKFNNMPLSHIQNIISEWPNSVTNSGVSRREVHTRPKSEPAPNENCIISLTQSQIARRASINLTILNHNEPGDQHTAIEPFKDCPTPAPFLPASGDQQHIPRTPIICPITECTCSSVFVSEFAKHVRVNHVRVPTEVVQPGAGTNLFVDTELDELNMSRCRMMYLVTGKIHSLGSSRYKHYLPVLLMTARIDLHRLLQPGRMDTKPFAANQCTLVWLTGLYASDQPLHYTLSAWHRRGKVPNTHLVHSGQLYSIRSGQEPADVFHSGHGMVLTRRQMADLSEGGESLVKMQVILY